jgi:hypothetical protein
MGKRKILVRMEDRGNPGHRKRENRRYARHRGKRKR